MIVAARTAVTNWIGMEDSKGNQYRFINCGLEQLQQFPPASKQDSSSQRIMVVFRLGIRKKILIELMIILKRTMEELSMSRIRMN